MTTDLFRSGNSGFSARIDEEKLKAIIERYNSSPDTPVSGSSVSNPVSIHTVASSDSGDSFTRTSISATDYVDGLDNTGAEESSDSAIEASRRVRSMLNAPLTREELDTARREIEAFARRDGVDFSKLSKAEKEFYLTLYVLKMRGDISTETFVNMMRDFMAEDSGESVQENVPDGARTEDDIRLDRISSRRRRHRSMRDAMIFAHFGRLQQRVGADGRTGSAMYNGNCALGSGKFSDIRSLENPSEFLSRALDLSVDADDKITDVAMQSLPDNTTEDVARRVHTEFRQSHRETVQAYRSFVQSAGLPSSEMQAIVARCDALEAKFEQMDVASFDRFLKSDKGKAIVKYTRQVAQEIQQKKERVRELATVKKQAELQVVKTTKTLEVATDNVKQETRHADALVFSKTKGKVSFGSVKFEQTLKAISPKDADKYAAAQSAEKKAFWANYDAQSAKRLANLFLNIAQFNLARQIDSAKIAFVKMLGA